ncbi:hypothetical protein TWF694_007458 [Orbilia ellipsospora]|uniref:Uncharacterized protein n=1 Tax=Orbilia ellipsospora TaxID=2528407 RepID=A0AAV9XI89_9PEZI
MENRMEASTITFPAEKGLEYYNMSARANYNFKEPFLYLAKKLLRKDDLEFLGDFVRVQEIIINDDQQTQLAKELEVTKNIKP